MSKHTPGPWSFGQDTIFSGNGDKNSKVIAATNISIKYSPKRYISLKEDRANAILIAAAPDLLENLRECISVIKELQYLYSEKIGTSALNNAEAAILKATKE